MATVAELELKIRVLTERLEELERAKRGTNEFKEAVAGLRNQILALGTALIGLDKLKDFVDTGVEVNKTLESTRLGIAGIVTSQAELRDSQGQVLEGQDAFNAATGIASDQLKKLKVDSLSTVSTFGELKDAFQAAISPGLGAGLDLDQIRNLTKEIAIASKAIGLQTNQIAQETRAILTGDIDMNAQLARNLGITSEMVARWKEQGTLAQELEKRLHGFVLAGDATAKSWAGVTSNMQEAYETLAGLATAGFYDAIKEKLNDALSGVFALNTGELEESLQGVSGLLTEILTDLGEVIGDSIVGMVDGIKQFSAYIQDNQGEIKDMEANFGLVFDQVKAIAGGVLEAVKAIASAGAEGKVLSNTFEVIAGTLAAFRDGVDFIAMAFTKLGAVVLKALAFPIEKAGKLLSAFGLETGNIMQDVSRHMQDQAKAADESAGRMWQNFADGKTHVAALNAEAEKLHTLIDIPRSGGFDHLRDQILDFTAKLKDAKPPMEEIRAEAERLRSQVQVMFDAGQLSREEYIVALAKIDGALKRLSGSGSVGKKEFLDLSEAFDKLNVSIGKTNLNDLEKAQKKINQEFRDGNVTVEKYNEAFLAYAKAKVQSAIATGTDIGATLKDEAAKRGLSEALKKIIADQKALNPELEAYLSNTGKIIDKKQLEIGLLDDENKLQIRKIKKEIELATLQNDKIKTAELTIKAAKEEVKAIEDRIKSQNDLVESLREELKEAERIADADGERDEKEKKRIDNLRVLISKETSRLEIDRAKLPIAKQELEITSNLSSKAQVYIGILAGLNRQELQISRARASAMSNMERIAELNLDLANASGDVYKIQSAQRELDSARANTNTALLGTLRDSLQVAKDEYTATLLKVTADGKLSIEESKLLETKQAAIDLAQSDLATKAEEIEKTEDLTKAKRESAEATEKEAKAEREHTDQLKAAGEAFTETLSGWAQRLNDLSPAARKAFDGFNLEGEKARDTALEIADALDGLAAGGFVAWANQVAIKALQIEQNFNGQAQAAEDMAARIDQAMASNSGNLGALVREAESARGSFDLLDQARLDNLQQAIDAARDKMEQLRDASLSALDAAQRALLQEQGKQKELLELDLAQKKLEIQKQLNEARDAGDQEALRNLQKALDLEEQTYQIKLKKLKASESNTTTTTAPSAPAGGNTTINYNITADVSSLATEDFWRKKVLPISDKINRLRG